MGYDTSSLDSLSWFRVYRSGVILGPKYKRFEAHYGVAVVGTSREHHH